jgi:transcriptional pleiotropic regulator of transition state genes
MRSTGIVRRVDSLGRVVIPEELRRMFGLTAGSDVEMYREAGDAVIAKYRPCCLFCGAEGGLEAFRRKWVCQACLEGLTSLKSETVPGRTQ